MQTSELAAKLAALHDLVVPAPVPWWPPAPAGHALIVLAGAVVGWGAWRAYRRWRANAYRRMALRELASIREELADPAHRATALAELAVLVRRAALHVAPRERVAALSGEAWLAFLDERVGGNAFRSATGQLIATGAYQPATAIARIPRTDLDALCHLVERWLRRHRVTREARKS